MSHVNIKMINQNQETGNDDDNDDNLNKCIFFGRVMILLLSGGVVYLMSATTRQSDGAASMQGGTNWLCATVRTFTNILHVLLLSSKVKLKSTYFLFPETPFPVSGTPTAYFPSEQDCLTTMSSSELRGAVLQVVADELKTLGVDGEPQLCLVCGRT